MLWRGGRCGSDEEERRKWACGKRGRTRDGGGEKVERQGNAEVKR